MMRPPISRVILTIIIILLELSSARGILSTIRPVVISTSRKLKEDLRPQTAVNVIKRFPGAVGGTLESSLKAFLSTAVVIMPIGFIWNIGLWRSAGFKAWVREGSKMGTEWGWISAVYSGADMFAERIRGVDDKWNAYFGSGMASAIMRAKEGPWAMTQGFVSGFAIVYVFEKLLSPDLEPRPDPLAAGSSPSLPRASTKSGSSSSSSRHSDSHSNTHSNSHSNPYSKSNSHSKSPHGLKAIARGGATALAAAKGRNYSPYKGVPASKYYAAAAAAKKLGGLKL